MARYPLNLPEQLKREAEQWAVDQGISLNQFILNTVHHMFILYLLQRLSLKQLANKTRLLKL